MAQRDPRRAEPPPTETGPVPIAYVRAEARYFGLPPHVLVLALGALGVGAAIGLLAGGPRAERNRQ
jgi:hypothetical protein